MPKVGQSGRKTGAKKATPQPRCKACAGSGTSSKGERCYPCNGSGVQGGRRE